jgi:hypothetical protein
MIDKRDPLRYDTAKGVIEMRPVPVRPLSRALSVCVWFVILCNVIVLCLLPFILAWRYSSLHSLMVFLVRPKFVYPALWGEYILSLWVFYPCGLCTLAALWQSRNILRNMVTDTPFSMRNARCMRRIAVCCFIIAGCTLVREIYWLMLYPLTQIIWYYNTFFVPFFAVAGLFCLLLAEFFRQAGELREENSLVI